ncbi:efflux RND transporter permease subunit, partial [bacterium]
VIGIVVDDAIMVLENIVRHREQGLPQVKAAIVGAREIYFAAMAASVAILAIFVPVLFVKGVIGKYFLQFGVTISAAVMLSLLESLTLAPMRCSQFLQVGGHTGLSKLVDDAMLWSTARYRGGLSWCLGRRWRVLVSATALFVASLALFGVVRKELMPAQDQSMMLIQLETPVGSSLESTDAAFKRAEAYLMARGELDRYYTAVGGFEGGEINSGMIFVTLKDPAARPVPPGRSKAFTQQELQDVFRKELSALPGLTKVILLDLSTGGGGAEPGFPVDFTLQGKDWDQLAALSEKFLSEMRKSGLMVDVNSNYKLGMPEVQVWPDRVEAAKRGVSVATIGNAINAAFGGVRAGKFTRGGHRYDIRARFAAVDRTDPKDIAKIQVRNNRGQVVPLSALVEVKERNSLLSITRHNRSRAIRLQANVASGKSQGDAIAAVEAAAERLLPEGVKLEFAGGAETFKESFMGLVVALVLGVFVAYMVLGAQFNSFIHPALVLLALPFSVTGAVLALVLGQQSLNMFSMIGIVLLMGIVKKNSILLVDFTNEQRKRGLGVDEALKHACPVRLRPILMTTAATIAAAIPPALALGPGAETRVPMALVIIGGVSVSTLLTLFVVPCAYSLAARLESHRHDARLREALAELGELPAPASGAPEEARL